jgi:hypothetical protein
MRNINGIYLFMFNYIFCKNRAYGLATFIDPRFKNRVFTDSIEFMVHVTT